ncbi:MAG: hypothetical protein ACI97B_000322 [Verrucomicrobiales bacterium]
MNGTRRKLLAHIIHLACRNMLEPVNAIRIRLAGSDGGSGRVGMQADRLIFRWKAIRISVRGEEEPVPIWIFIYANDQMIDPRTAEGANEFGTSVKDGNPVIV